MTEPILTREEVLKFFDGWCCSHPGCKDWVEIPEEVLVDRLAALQAAVLEKVCGEPMAWAVLECVHLKPCSVTLDHEDMEGHRPEHIVPLFALTRSKP